MRLSEAMGHWVRLAVLGFIPLFGCAEAGEGGAVSLAIAANRDTELMIGDALTFTVRKVTSDGASEDVTSSATCVLSGDVTGTLVSPMFMATAAGSSVVACDYEQATGTLVLTVRGPAIEGTSIEAIQAGDVVEGSSFNLADLVVTALVPPTESGFVDFFVQPAKGKADTGLFIVDVRANLEPAFAVGDVVSLTGTYIEEAGRSTIEAEVIEKTGRATPRVTDLDVADLDLDAVESALVRVKDVAVRDVEYTTYTWLLSDATDASLELELETYFFVPEVEQGSVLDSLTGIVFCSIDICAVAPRDDADIAVCADCEKVEGAPPPAMTPPGTQTTTRIQDIQTGAIAQGSAVILDEVVVTAVWPDGDRLDFWAQTAGGGPSSGIFFRDERPTAVALEIGVGSVLHVEGVTALRNSYPVVSYAVAEQKASAAAVTADVVTIAELIDPSLGRRYWGSLVEVADLNVMEVDASGYGVVVQAVDGTPGFVGNALFPELALNVSDTLSRVTGVVYLSTSGLEIWPRGAQDLVP